jgi:hypothetical protein
MLYFIQKRQKIPIRILATSLVLLISATAFIYVTRPVSAAPGPISGSVFNDANGNGIKDAGEGAFSNLAIVNLYNSSGTYVKSRTSDSSGNFSLAGLGAGTYYISVYNTGRGALLDTAPGLVNVIGAHVEPTYAGVGSGAGSGSGPICVGAAPTYTQKTNYTSNPSEWTTGAQNNSSAGPCFGGRKADVTNPILTTLVPPVFLANTDYTNLSTGLNTQKMVSKVVLTTNGGVSNVDFGLSANAVTNTSSSGQGSLSQFVTNANLIAGPNAMRFTPSVTTNQGSGGNTWWQINQGATPLPSITDAGTALDGRAYSNTDGTTVLNTNSGVINGATVGTLNHPIADYQKPELEVVGDVRAAGGTSLFQVAADNATITRFGLNSTTNHSSLASYFVQQTAGTAMEVADNLMGVNVASGANYSTRPLLAIQTAYLLSLNSTGTYRHNYISANDTRGMVLAGGLLGAGNVVPLLLGDWIIEQNDGPSAGVAFGAGTTRINVRYNRMPIAALDAAPLNSSLGLHTLTENTITGGGGAQLHAGLQNTITKNVITNASGSSPGVSVGNLSTGNFISQNSFSGNGGNAIDLNSDGVSANDLLNCVTLSPELVGLANVGIARPELRNVRLQGSTLTLDINYCAIGLYRVELYKAAAGSGDSGAGEGQTYLGSFNSLNLLNGTIPNLSLQVAGVSPGDSITALVIDPVLGNTSEFSPNAIASSPPNAPTTPPDMTSDTDSGNSNADNITNDTTPTFTGSCTNGQTVTLYVDGQAVTPSQVCANGSYSITPTNPIAGGNHTVSATFANASGESAQGPALGFTIDATASSPPSAPDMTDATDSGSSTTDNITNVARPIFTGTCTSGETLTFYLDTQAVGTAVCTGGSYSFQPATLGNGDHTLSVTTTDEAGNVSASSSTLTFTIDTSILAVPTMTSPANGSITNNSQPTFNGAGENGARVTVKDSNGATICTAIVTGGTWTCSPASPLADGSFTFRVTQTDTAGNISVQSGPVQVTIDTVAPQAPTIAAPGNSSATNDPTPTLTGMATAGATVRLTIDGQAPVTVTADENGQWSYVPPSNLAEGSHTVSAVQLDGAGNVSPASSPVTFTVDTTRPTVTVNKAFGQADPSVENEIRFTIAFSEPINPGTLTPSDIIVATSPNTNNVVIDSLIQTSDRTWDVVLSGMPNHTTVTVNLGANAGQDFAGNNSLGSTSTDNSVLYEVTGPSITPLVTNDSTPLIEGECVAGHEMRLELSGPAAPVFTTTCQPGNVWSYSISAPLADGSYDVLVTDTTATISNPIENRTDALVIDTVRPNVTINQADDQADPTNQDSARFTITFAKPILATTFIASDLSLTGTSGTVELAQIDEVTWEATVSGMTSGDNPTLTLVQGKVSDRAGNTNLASTSTDNSVSFDSVKPDAPAIISPTDGAVLSNQPTITGNGENGTTVTVIIDGATASCSEGSPIIVTNGTWTCTPTGMLADGSHSVTTTLRDTAGNVSNVSGSIAFTIDSTPPATLAAPDLVPASDTGSSSSDNITRITTPQFTGSCMTGDTITLYSDGTIVAQTSCEGNSYTLAPSSALSDGQHSMTVGARDSVGNTAMQSEPLIVTIDSTSPLTPVASSPQNGSLVTTTPVISGSGETGAVLGVLIDDTEVTCLEGSPLVVENGSWSCTPTIDLQDGGHTIQAMQMDAAGNQSPRTSTITINIDSVPPAILATPDLTPASDSGSSNTDNITNDTTPSFNGTCTTGDTVRLFMNNIELASVTCASGAYLLTPTTAVESGSYEVRVSATDPAGNVSLRSPALTVIIDSVRPNALSTPDLLTADDSGLSNTDNITNVTQPRFTGSCTTSEVVTLYINGSFEGQGVCPAEGQYVITSASSLPGGQYIATVTVTDIAGNISESSAVLNFSIVTSAPGQLGAPDLTPASDSGVSNTDNITNMTSPVLVGSCQNGDVIALFVDTVRVAEGACVDGGYSLSPSSALSDGERSLTVKATNIAGNTSQASGATIVTILTSTPSTPDAPDLVADSDSGLSDSDNLTNDTSPSLSGSCLSNTVVAIYVDDTLATQQACDNGTYSVTLSGIADGVHAVTVEVSDKAGNKSSMSNALTITIDTTASDPVITTPTNNGIVSDDTPLIGGTGETGGRVTLLRGQSQIACTEDPIIVSGSSWSCTPTQPMPDGQYVVTARQTDIAGNISGNVTVTFTISATAPDTLDVPDLTNGSDSGVSNTDNITNAQPLVFTGSCVTNTIITLYSDGLTVGQVACANGAYSISSTTIGDGVHAMTATATNAGGAVSLVSPALQITVDRSPPAPLAPPNMTSGTDSGASNTDNITNNPRPRFTGSCVTGTTVLLRAGSSTVGQATCTNGSYDVMPTNALPDGNYTLMVVAVDAAGNASNGATLDGTIDTVAPASPVVTTPNNSASNNQTPTVSGTGENNSTLAVNVNSAPITCVQGSQVIVVNNAWNCTTPSLPEGNHTISTTLTDQAGNSSPSVPLTITIDVTPPSRPGRPDLIASSDSGVSNTDNVTNVTTPTFSGSCVSGDVVRLRINTVTMTQMTCANNSYLMTVPTAMADGTYNISTTATDRAGNVSTSSFILSITVDTVAAKPATPFLDPGSDSGYSQTDGITNAGYPTGSGICQANETVFVYFDGVYTTTTTCFPPFYAQPPQSLANGQHTLAIRVIDIVGNTSPMSDPYMFTVDNMSPGLPTVTAPNQNSVINSSSYTASGVTAEPGNWITVTRDNTVLCSVQSNANKQWSCQLSNLSGGNQTHRFRATDLAGNPSGYVDRTVTINPLVR